MTSKRILMPMARLGSDPSELALPWKLLRDAHHEVIFATPDGRKGQGDPRMLTGEGLGVAKGMLRADAAARAAYAEMERSDAFSQPLTYGAWGDASTWDALILPGGHDKPIREYLESEAVQALAASFFAVNKPVAAICHGVLVVGRARDQNGRSLLHGRKTTSLTNALELSAYTLTRLWMGDYYRTYAQTTEDEVRTYMARSTDYTAGPLALRRDSPHHIERGFCVRDGNYVSARWPGDAHRFTAELIKLL